MPKRKYGYKILNGHMGGRSKNLCSVEVVAVVDLSLDDVETDNMDRSDLSILMIMTNRMMTMNYNVLMLR